ncbi:MAG: GEVED domain-containing protein, partial [Bacteroidia bacterium]
FDYGISTGDSIYYRVQVACNAGTPVMSNIIKLLPNTNTYGCYCNSAASTIYDDDIGAFSFGSFNNIQSVTPSLSNPVSVNLYTNYTNLGPIAAQQASSYPISITQINQAGFYNCYATIYIDFDHSGTYDFGEDVYTGYTANASSNVLTGTVFIPGTAMTGITGVRVVLSESNTNACGTYSYGETEDYLINIAAGVTCTGTPTAGTLNTTDTTICPGSELNLVLLGNTQAVGITTEWETSADGITGWAATGDTLPNLTIYGPSDSIYYRVKVSCNGGAPVYTLVTKIAASPTYACYCSSNLSPTCYAAITNVTLGGTTLNNSTTCTNGYTSYFPTTASTTTDLTQALSYTLNVTTANGILTGVWIDYDQSGSFDGTEYTDLIMSSSNGTATINIPASALLGKTGMRIRTTPSTWPGLNGSSACSSLWGNGGEIEDYVINIVAGVPCAGTPTAGVLTTTTSSLCPSDFAMLTIVGQTQALNIHTVWESSADGITGWAATGDSSLSLQVYAPSDSIYIRIAVDCNGGAPVYTNVIKLTATPSNLCYCTNSLGGQCGQGNIEDIIIPTTTLNNTNTGCNNNFGIANYSRFPEAGSTTATLTQTGSYTITGKFDSLVELAVVWIDYNQDGVFDINEIAQWSNPSATASSLTITVPASAVVGKTGMRIRTSTYTGGVLDACNNQWSGETEDYILTIAAATTCAGAPTAGTISTTANKMCASELATLTLSGTTIGLGIHTAWQTSPDGSTAWVNTGDSAATLSINAPADSMYYRVAVGCNAGTLVYSNVIKIKLNTTFYECYCASAAQYYYDNDIGGVTIGTFSNNQSLTPTTFNAASVNTYTNYQSLGPISLLKSTLNNPLTITQIDNSSFYTCNIAVFIDYDHSGTFDATEEILTGTTNSSVGGNVLDSVFTVPATALNGVTGLRVILAEYTTITSSCISYFAGETEDYLVTIADSVLTPTQLIAKQNSISFIAYPNPTMDVVNIALEGNTSDAVICEVMNNFGQIVYTNVTKQLNGVEKLKVDLSAYASGAYTIRVIANNNVTVKRILLQR